jgi:hypothetical protein
MRSALFATLGPNDPSFSLGKIIAVGGVSRGKGGSEFIYEDMEYGPATGLPVNFVPGRAAHVLGWRVAPGTLASGPCRAWAGPKLRSSCI